MSWAFARCSCGDVIERHAEYWLHLGRPEPASRKCPAMLETRIGDPAHQAVYELIEHRVYMHPAMEWEREGRG